MDVQPLSIVFIQIKKSFVHAFAVQPQDGGFQQMQLTAVRSMQGQVI
jgi:hypothetical protein